MYGIDTDNGGEFINAQLLAWCGEHHIPFTKRIAPRNAPDARTGRTILVLWNRKTAMW
jgi:hypothetical protein